MPKFDVKNLLRWIQDNEENLKPPVCNKEIYPGGDFIVMVIGGPNERIDYHYNETAEFFYQIKGNIVLKIIEDGKFKDVGIKEGEIYLLPPKIPHSPQRPADTIGLVIEQKRDIEKHTDGFQWYCPRCHNQLHEDYFKLVDIEKQLPKVFTAFKENTALHKCNRCGYVHQV